MRARGITKNITFQEYQEVIKFIDSAQGRMGAGNAKHPKTDKDFECFVVSNERQRDFNDFVNVHSLNSYDVSLIRNYSGLAYDSINSMLRKFNAKRSDSALMYEYLLNTSLAKIKPYNDTAYVDFHGAYNEQIFDWFSRRINNSVQFPNFLSASNYKWKDKCLYLEIHTAVNSRGKYIAPISNVLSEQEVLFMSNSKFQIQEVLEAQKTIVLQEINNEVSANYILYDCFTSNINDRERPPQLFSLI